MENRFHPRPFCPEGKVFFVSREKMDLIDEVFHFIQEQELFAVGERIVVAVSGGPDSIALLDVLLQLRERLGIELHLAHLNHRLRGAQSDADAEFVRELAGKFRLDATIEGRDVPEFIRQRGFSPEEGAREVRYQFLREVAQRVGATKIATGHNLDDQAETVLFRLLRGAGGKGLSGIPPAREGLFVRPLLRTSRSQIEEYLAQRGLAFRHDASNDDISYTRNRIRHGLMPLLKEDYNPDIATALARTAEILRDEDNLLEEQAAQGLSAVVTQKTDQKIILDIDRFLGYHISLRRRMLRNIVQQLLGTERYPEFAQVERLLHLAGSKSGWAQIDSELRAQRSGDLLIVKKGRVPPFQKRLKIPTTTRIPELNARISTRVLAAEQFRENPRQASPQTVFLDLDTICGELAIRSRRPGDSFQPLGLKGHKKVSDLLTDRKVPRILRDEIPILTDEEKIIWVAGIEINALCRLTAGTRQILKAHLQPDEPSPLLMR